MAELKTKQNKESVAAFLQKQAPERRKECQAVLKMMEEATGAKARMWGKSMVGFGKYRYRYDSGREGEWMAMGFSPRKSDLTLYVLPGLQAFTPLLKRLGQHKTGKSCLYLKSLEDVDQKVLKKLLKEAAGKMAKERVE
jgi:hypothetical protein